MEKLFDETYASEDGKLVSRNIWYGYAELSADGAYGKELRLSDSLIEEFCKIIKGDLTEHTVPAPTETNWYIYGDFISQDAIGESIRPAIMVRERSGEFVVNFNISDHDFATKIDAVLSFQANFEARLAMQ